MKVGIIGYGFVGSALKRGITKNAEILCIDPKLNTQVSDLEEYRPDIIFICVPTPMSNHFEQDISIVKDVFKEINDLQTQSLIVLKSTVTPDNLVKLENIINDFIYNPEFLREKHADLDFINSPLIIFGGNERDSKVLEDFYKNFTNCKCTNYFYTDLITASFVKYSINSFLATKVIFFNELQMLFSKSGSKEDWQKFIKIISQDPRIGDSHMQVPGHDGRFGFGGACLPKDASAFINYSDSRSVNLNLLKTTINTNNKIRATYNKKTNREIEQNIDFGGEK